MENDNKKKTLTITSSLKRKIDTSSINTGGKKSFAVEKKKTFKESKASVKNNQTSNHSFNSNFKKKNFARKFIDQQTTKDFIQKENKPTVKSKLKL